MQKRGNKALVHDTLAQILGLSSDTIDLVMQQIRNSGEYGNVIKHVTNMPGDLKNRLNITLDTISSDKTPDNTDGAKPAPEKKDQKDQKEKITVKREDKKVDESQDILAPTFKTFLQEMGNQQSSASTNTVAMDVDPKDIKDPIKRREAMRKQRQQRNPSMKKRQLRDRIAQLKSKMATGE